MFKCQGYLCVNEKICPVTSVKLLSLNNNQPNIETSSSDTLKISIERNVEYKPLTKLEISHGDFPCVNGKRDPTFSGKIYPLLNGIKGCGEYGNKNHYAK